VGALGFELDHVFVAVRQGAPELAALVRAGFDEGAPNVHAGQGTACRRVFVENAYLEFLWLEDAIAALAPPVERTGLVERTRCLKGVSRLGVALRPSPGANPEQRPQIRTWSYRPAYMPPGASLSVAANAEALYEPLLFFTPNAYRPGLHWVLHPNGARRMTGVQIELPAHSRPSPELTWLGTVPGVRLKFGEAELLTVELDGGVQGQSASLAPSAPVQVHW